MNRTKIAILGATSHIAKGLVRSFLQTGQYRLSLFGRSADRINSFLNSLPKGLSTNCSVFEGYGDFLKQDYDAVLNCVGVGTSNKLEQKYYKWFTVTEEFDNLSISYLDKINPQAIYLSFSSGAVYGRDFEKPSQQDTVNPLPVNSLNSTDYYGIARLNAETKHRAYSHLNIVDLRIFSFFSRFIDLTDKYLMTELLNCTRKERVFRTNNSNIIRDFIHPEDLFSMIEKCLETPSLNEAFDMTSRKPVDKWTIIHYFQDQFGLQVVTDSQHHSSSATGSKEHYYSIYQNMKKVGFKAVFTSMDTIRQETEAILKQ